jgi:hypothetical protein
MIQTFSKKGVKSVKKIYINKSITVNPTPKEESFTKTIIKAIGFSMVVAFVIIAAAYLAYDNLIYLIEMLKNLYATTVTQKEFIIGVLDLVLIYTYVIIVKHIINGTYQYLFEDKRKLSSVRVTRYTSTTKN